MPLQNQKTVSVLRGVYACVYGCMRLSVCKCVYGVCVSACKVSVCAPGVWGDVEWHTHVEGAWREGKQRSDQAGYCRCSNGIGVYPKSNGLLPKAFKQRL